MERVQYLWELYQQGRMTIGQRAELNQLLQEEGAREEFLRLIDGVWSTTGDGQPMLDAGTAEQVLRRINSAAAGTQVHRTTVHRIHFLKTAWIRWAAAIIILFGIGTYIFTQTAQPDKEVVVGPPSPTSNDIAPGYNRATLTLSDGKKVNLDSTATETITDQTLSIENNNGQLIYKNNDLVAVNTMSTPKGGQYKLLLADGTTVWLNAASSITFPTAFKGKTREVSITGEAYFEVAKNKSKPFIVRTTSDQITVLGTSFNVNAYTDEAGVRTSLINGAVRIAATNLRPGEAYQQGNVTTTNISQDIAWKNGYFDFNKVDAAGALRQIARWYNVSIQFTGGIPKKVLEGKMGRDLNLSQVMETLHEIGIKTQLKGNVLLILP